MAGRGQEPERPGQPEKSCLPRLALLAVGVRSATQ